MWVLFDCLHGGCINRRCVCGGNSEARCGCSSLAAQFMNMHLQSNMTSFKHQPLPMLASDLPNRVACMGNHDMAHEPQLGLVTLKVLCCMGMHSHTPPMIHPRHAIRSACNEYIAQGRVNKWVRSDPIAPIQHTCVGVNAQSWVCFLICMGYSMILHACDTRVYCKMMTESPRMDLLDTENRFVEQPSGSVLLE